MEHLWKTYDLSTIYHHGPMDSHWIWGQALRSEITLAENTLLRRSEVAWDSGEMVGFVSKISYTYIYIYIS